MTTRSKHGRDGWGDEDDVAGVLRTALSVSGSIEEDRSALNRFDRWHFHGPGVRIGVVSRSRRSQHDEDDEFDGIRGPEPSNTMPMTMSEGHEPLHSEEDVEEILRLAVRHTGTDAGSLRERLAASADELGISPEALAEAERMWAGRRKSQADQELEARDRVIFKKMKFAELFQHIGIYAIVNAFLFWIDFRDGRVSWVMWPVAGWGIAVAIHTLVTFVHGPDEEKEFQRWRKRRQKKLDRI